MQTTGTLSINDNAREARLNGTLLAIQGSTDPFGSATAFLENRDFSDGAEARITGTEGQIGNVEVIFMTDAVKVAEPVPAMAAHAPHFEFTVQAQSPSAQNHGISRHDTGGAAIVPPKGIVPPTTDVPRKTKTHPRKPILPPKSWVLSKTGEFVEETKEELATPKRSLKPAKKSAAKKPTAKKATAKKAAVKPAGPGKKSGKPAKKKAAATKKKAASQKATKKKSVKKKANKKKASGRR